MSLPVAETKIAPDDSLQRVTGQIFVGQAVLIAHDLGFFKSLSQQARALIELASDLDLEIRAAQALASCASAMGLVTFENGKYQLTEVGEYFLSGASDRDYGKVLDLLVDEQQIMTFASLRDTITSNSPQKFGEEKLFDGEGCVSNTKKFVEALHHKAIAPAFHWQTLIDFSNEEVFIDIGGGSGVHTIAACLSNPKLTGVVCDRGEVLPHTKFFVDQYALTDRILTARLDMFEDELPKGDIHFYGDILHDWSYEKCFRLMRKSFKVLNLGGKVILHEMLFNNDKTGPFLTAAYNMKMMAWTEGQQLSENEIIALLSQAGFQRIKIIPSLSNWSIIVGEKL